MTSNPDPAPVPNPLDLTKDQGLESIPESIPAPLPRRWPSAMWLLTLACAVLSLGLVFNAYGHRGEIIEIEFEQGHGLQPSDALRFRGIEIGRVETIDLRSNPPGIRVGVRLTPNARSVITDGTAFWIARPIVSLESVRGLETIIGPKYIAMEPGQGEASRTVRFVGLEAPPPMQPREGSMEIVLDATKRFGLESGAPILHRGFRVGDILTVGLASDARSVIVRCAIDPEFHELIRANSKFWVRSGWSIDIGLTGIQVDADNLSQILNGGVEFATPDAKGAVASTGARFVLHEKPLAEWMQWQPSIPYGVLWERMQQQAPQSQRFALRWQEKSFGFTVNQQRLGWCLLLDDQTLVCRSDGMELPKGALPNSATIEVAGFSMPWKEPLQVLPLANGKSLIKLQHPALRIEGWVPYPAREVFRAVRPGEVLPDTKGLLVIGPEASRSILLDWGRLTPVDAGWSVAIDSRVPDDLDGALVLELPGGKIVGCVDRIGRNVVIASLKPTP